MDTSTLSNAIESAKVIAKAIITWLLVIVSVLTYAAEQIQPIADSGDDVAQTILAWLLRILGGLAIVVTAIRRHTPILDPALRGITGPSVTVTPTDQPPEA